MSENERNYYEAQLREIHKICDDAGVSYGTPQARAFHGNERVAMLARALRAARPEPRCSSIKVLSERFSPTGRSLSPT